MRELGCVPNSTNELYYCPITGSVNEITNETGCCTGSKTYCFEQKAYNCVDKSLNKNSSCDNQCVGKANGEEVVCSICDDSYYYTCSIESNDVKHCSNGQSKADSNNCPVANLDSGVGGLLSITIIDENTKFDFCGDSAGSICEKKENIKELLTRLQNDICNKGWSDQGVEYSECSCAHGFTMDGRYYIDLSDDNTYHSTVPFYVELSRKSGTSGGNKDCKLTISSPLGQ